MDNRKNKNKVYERLGVKFTDENIERLTSEQLNFIIQGYKQNLYLEACPGSGKTEIVGIKAAYEINNWKDSFSGISIVSFTNNAAKEIENRIKKYAGIKATSFPHFIGTFDSFFYNYILYPFFHGLVKYEGNDNDKSPKAIIDERSDADFLKNSKYKPRTRFPLGNNKSVPIPANKYYYDSSVNDILIFPPNKLYGDPISLTNLLKKPEFIYLFKKYPKLTKDTIYEGFFQAKRNFWKDGYITFKDSEFIIQKILNNNPQLLINFINRFPILIIDECQDLSPVQLEILQLLLNKGVKLFLIGDLNQSIFEFRKVDPSLTNDFIVRNSFKNLRLTTNFRSNQKIVDVFCKIFPSKIIGNEKHFLRNSLVLIEYNESKISELIARYKELIIESNTEIGLELVKIKNSAIIIRGSLLISKFKPFKSESKNPITNLALSLHLWNLNERNSEIIKSSLYLLGFFLSKVFYNGEGDARNYFCLHGFSNSEWRIFLASLLKKMNNKFYPFENAKNQLIKFSDFGSFVRKEIKYIAHNLIIESFSPIDKISFQVEKGFSNRIVNEYVSDFKIKDKIRIATIHSIKGETLDSALIVSSKNAHSKGGFWKQWFNNSPINDIDFEYKRLGYVAFSRPKHLLVLATPSLNIDDRRMFEKLGFVIENLKVRTLF